MKPPAAGQTSQEVPGAHPPRPGPGAAAPGAAPAYRSPILDARHQSLDFLRDPEFLAAYRFAMEGSREALRRVGATPEFRHEWPVLVCCWAAWHALHLPGDLVECGTQTGISSMAVARYIDLNRTDKWFYLFDTFCGIPTEQMSEREKQLGREALSARAYVECYETARANFAPFPRARLVRGTVPASLTTVPIERVCYLHLDMNITYPEIAAITYFWPRLSPGAPVILDDYGKAQFVEQKRAMDEFAAAHGVRILPLPTGQGLLLKTESK